MKKKGSGRGVSEVDLTWLDTQMWWCSLTDLSFFLGDHKLMYFVFFLLLVPHEGRVSAQVLLRGLRVEESFSCSCKTM